MYLVNLHHLKAEAKYLMDTCFWASGNYWSTRDPKLKKDKAKTGIKIAYLNKTGWVAFIFTKFQGETIEIFRSLEKGEAWFYQEPVNQFKSFSAWCIAAKHFKAVLGQMQSLKNIELEFVVSQAKQRLCVPTPFEPMGLQFYEVGRDAKKDAKLKPAQAVSLSTVISSNEHLVETHRLEVKHVLELLEDACHDDPQEHQG